MRWQNLLLSYVKGEERERIVGRYFASELFSIIKGYLKPKDFFKKKDINLYGAECIAGGVMAENYLKEVLEYNKAKVKCQEKKEIKIDDFVLVVKPDFIFENMVWEVKCPDSPMRNEIPDKWKYQLCAEAKAFNLPVYLGIFRRHPFLTLIEYQLSDRIWGFIQKRLREFHQELLKLPK